MKKRTREHLLVKPSDLEKTTWVVVANDAGAKLLRAKGVMSAEVIGDIAPSSEQHERDRTEEFETHFAATIAQSVEKGRRGRKFSRLVLVSGPKLLGKIRAGLTKSTQSLVSGEFSKDYAHLSNSDLIRRVNALLGLRAGTRAA